MAQQQIWVPRVFGGSILITYTPAPVPTVMPAGSIGVGTMPAGAIAKGTMPIGTISLGTMPSGSIKTG